MNKHDFTVPFVCGARDLGEGLRRIAEGAAMIRTKGEAGTGDVSEAVRHARTIRKQIKIAQSMDSTELYGYAKELRVPVDLLKKTAELGRLPVVNFAAGGLGNLWFGFMVFNTTFSNISAISGWSVLLVEETGIPGENRRPAVSH